MFYSDYIIVYGILIGKIFVVFISILGLMAYLTWLERKLIAHFQVRIGPNRVGLFGLLQPIADGIKLLFKEDIVPLSADKFLYLLAPFLSFTMAIVIFAVVPFGYKISLFGKVIPLQIADINIGILFVLGIASLGVYGIVLGGWASNSKYPFLGGIRSSAQMISYELSMGLAIVSVLLWSESLRLSEIVEAQDKLWFVFNPALVISFLIYLICGLAETQRIPFDLAEAESELVAGFHTEYSSMKFAMFFLGEYINIIAVCAVAVTMFLGGWHGPLPTGGNFEGLFSSVNFLLKLFIFIFLFMWLRATLPRLRYDMLMSFGWRILLPLALGNVLFSAAVIAVVRNWV